MVLHASGFAIRRHIKKIRQETKIFLPDFFISISFLFLRNDLSCTAICTEFRSIHAL